MKQFIALLLFISITFYNTSLNANDDSLPIHGFFDIDARYIGKEKKSKFATGYLDFYITKSINDKMNILIDLVFETIDNEYAVDIERLNITYDVNEHLTITSGKFHTPYGYWNTAFHHGLQIQTSILRPKFVAFEDRGGVLPSHSVGVMAGGSFNDLDYNVYLSSGVYIRKEAPDGTNTIKGIITTSNGENQDGNKLLGATLAYNINDIKLGLHSFYQRVEVFKTQSVDVFMSGAFLAIELDSFELYSETYFFNNHDNNGPSAGKTLNSQASFLQIAYDFDGIKPYARIEYAQYNDKDTYFLAQRATAGGSYDRAALGINYSLAEDANLKIALIRTDEHSLSTTYDVLTQFAIRF